VAEDGIGHCRLYGKTRECRYDRGRAALQGRVKQLKINAGFSPVIAVGATDFSAASNVKLYEFATLDYFNPTP
jgi:hypothetical protein